MKTTELILVAILIAVIVSASVLTMSFYIKEPTKVAGFSAYEKIKSIEDVRKISGYEHVQLPSYVPEGFDFGPLIYQGKGDVHHGIHLFYGSEGESYEEMKNSGFRVTFSDYVESSWEEMAKTKYDSFSTINNKTVVYHQVCIFNKSCVVYRGEPQSISITSSILDLSEQEKILRSAITKSDFLIFFSSSN